MKNLSISVWLNNLRLLYTSKENPQPNKPKPTLILGCFKNKVVLQRK